MLAVFILIISLLAVTVTPVDVVPAKATAPVPDDPDDPAIYVHPMDPARQFGRFSGGAEGEIEAVVVDDALGYVYYADEGDGIHKYYADPDHPQAASELAHFGREGFKVVRGGADGTDGLEVTSSPLGAALPHGLMVAMNSGPRNFLYFRWEDVANAGPVKLKTSR